MQTRFSAERVMEAPAEVVYHLISDYREHHRDAPEGFLPSAFTDLVVVRGGVGEGTAIRFTSQLGGRRQTVTASIAEPEPGRVLVESGPGVETTFTVEPEGAGRARVRFDIRLEGKMHGVGLRRHAPPRRVPAVEERFQPRVMRHAKAHPALAPAVGA